ncbi:MAG: hypothetical protein V7606_1798, partial [Burkholderiales bacterium]
LDHALEELDVDGVEGAIETLRGYDDGLATTLAQLAYRYEYGRIQELIAKR